MVRDVIGEIKRPLIFRLKSLFQLYEIVASKMYVKDCVYPIIDVPTWLMNAVSVVVTGQAVSGAGFNAPGGNFTVPTGKRWLLKNASLFVDTAGGGLAVVALAVKVKGVSSAGGVGGGANLISTPETGAIGLAPSAQVFNGSMWLEPGDQVGYYVLTTDATEKITFGAVCEEHDFRENVV